MIRSQLLDVLASHGLEPIPALGEQFDPHVHEAVLYEPTAEHSEGEVIEEILRGYKLNGRVLRPSKVKVAAGPTDDKGKGEKVPVVIKDD